VPQYYIEDGVHRAVALRENKVRLVPANLWELGKGKRLLYVELNQLHSPRRTVSMTPGTKHDLPRLLALLSTPLGRLAMPPIDLQPLGIPGQTGSVPLAQVQIVP